VPDRLEGLGLLYKFAFFESVYGPDGTPSEQIEFTPAQFAKRMVDFGRRVKPASFHKGHLNEAKAIECFVAGDCPARGDVRSRSAVVLDADSTADVRSVLAATEGYERVYWCTYKSGLSKIGDTKMFQRDDKALRARFVVFLDRPIPADQWRPDAVKALFPGADPNAVELGRFNYCPATWSDDVSDDALDVEHDPGTLFPADRLLTASVASTTLAVEPTDAIELIEPTGMLDRDAVTALAARYTRRIGAWDKRLGKWLKAIVRGQPFVTESSHEPTLDLARVLAIDFPDVSAAELAKLVTPSLMLMQRMHGSDETPEGFTEKVRSWRKKDAARKQYLADIPIPGSGGSSPNGNTPGEYFDPPGMGKVGEVLDTRFAQFHHTSGVVETFAVGSGDVCVRQDTDFHLQSSIMREIPTYVDGRGDQKPMNMKKAQTMVDDWRPHGRALACEPAPSRFKSEPGPCFQRLPFDLAPGATPAWDEFMSRLSSPEIFKAFVWTGFEKKNQGRQVLWIRGEGEDGKSTALCVLLECLGAGGSVVSADTFTSRFGMAILDGKRFAFIPDCKNTRILMQEKLRNVTSGDQVQVERKGQDAVTKKLSVKLIIGSNYDPDITSARSDTSRLLYMTIDESKNKNDPAWATQLANELPYFLDACRAAYAALCPNHGKLPVDDAMRELVNDRADSYEEEFSMVASEFFQKTANPLDRMPAGPIFKKLQRSGPLEYGWKQPKYEAFKAYLKRQGIPTVKSSGAQYYVGVRSPNGAGNVVAFGQRKNDITKELQ